MCAQAIATFKTVTILRKVVFSDTIQLSHGLPIELLRQQW